MCKPTCIKIPILREYVEPCLRTSRRQGFFSFNQRERTKVGLSPMLDISQHRSRKGTPL